MRDRTKQGQGVSSIRKGLKQESGPCGPGVAGLISCQVFGVGEKTTGKTGR